MIEKLMAIGIFLIILAGFVEPTVHGSQINEVNRYREFMNKFIPGAPSFAYHITFKPEKIVDIPIGKKKILVFSIVKINMSAHDDFYLRFILSKAEWEPSESYQGDIGFMEKLKAYNHWLNTTWPLTKNVYYLKSKPIHFTPEMTNYSERIEISVFQKGSIGITLLAKMKNASLWVPVGGYGNINITGGNPIYSTFPVLYPTSIILILIIITLKIKRIKKSKL